MSEETIEQRLKKLESGLSRWNALVLIVAIIAGAAVYGVHLWTENFRYQMEATGPVAYVLDKKTGTVKYLRHGKVERRTR